MTVKGDTLRRIGESLFGARWRLPLALALGVDDRTVRRWAAGEFAPPETLPGQLKRLCEARRGELERYERKLLT